MDKSVLGLLNGLSKREYFCEDISDEFLQEELFPDVTPEEFSRICQKYSALLKSLVYSDMDLKQLEAFLSSQICKKEGGLTESQAAAVGKFWRANKQKIHDVVVDRTSWGDKVKSLNWRVDINTQSKDNSSVGAATAIFDLNVEKKHPFQASENIKFEMNIDQLNKVIGDLERIEKKIALLSGVK